MNMNQISRAEQLVSNMTGSKKTVKYIRKDNSLIERKEEEEKVILAEDNRQVLLG